MLDKIFVWNSQDQTAALYQSAVSAFITAGQRCTCARRLFIADDAKGDAFVDAFIRLSKHIKVGPYTDDPEPFMGSVISHQHALQHLASQEELLRLGAEPLLKMELLKENTGFLSPGIVDMTSVKDIQDKEIFAPFVQIYRYTKIEDAMHQANDTKYGLAAGILTDHQSTYEQFYKTVRAGLINWNRPTTGAASNLPFGGIGHSGNHRPSASFAADYCAYPIASIEKNELTTPSTLFPGITLP